MKLKDLSPQFYKPENSQWVDVDNIKEATAISFLCPKCFKINEDCHSQLIPFKIDEYYTHPWTHVSGTTYEDLTLSPSILNVNCQGHFFLTNGEIVEC